VFDVEDGFGNAVTNELFQINVTAVNDAPVLDNSGAMNMTPITEEDLNNNGDSVLGLNLGAGPNIITDPDIDPEGFAITNQSSSNGNWEYSTNNGNNWNSMGTVSDSSALLLEATHRIRFVPDGFNGETPWLDIRAWDLSSGVAGSKVDATTTGGTTAFSVDIERVDLTVSAVNDTPGFSTLPDSEDSNVASVDDGNFVAAGDFDGDGDLDLATTSRLGDVAWHENDGTGNFVASNVIATIDQPEQLVVADIDGDGAQDIVVANYGTGLPNDIIQFLNDGSGNFSAVSLPDSGDGIFSIDVGDVDGDGDLDIAAAGYTSDNVVWWEQDNVNGWTLNTVATTDGPYSVDIADINGDGSQDILIASFRADNIQVRYSDGLADPNFLSSNVHPLNAAFEAIAADVDNDGDQDIVFANWGTSERLGWLENSGASIPVFTEHLIDSGPWGTIYQITNADLNADGNMDLVISDGQIFGQVVQYLGDGTGNFSKTVIDDATSAESNVVVDIDADGDLDIIHSNEGDGFIRAVTNEDTAVFLDPIVVSDVDSNPGELQVSIVVGRAMA